MLHTDQVACFGGVGTQNNGSVHRCQHTFIGIGGNIRSVVFLFRIEAIGNHSPRRAVQDKSRHIRLGGDGSQVVFLCFFVLTAEFLFTLGAFHQGVFADGSQRVERLHTVDGYIAAENVLNVHNIEVLPVEYLLQRVHPQGVTHDLGTDLTVHITRKVVAQRGESDDAGCDQKQHRQYAE